MKRAEFLKRVASHNATLDTASETNAGQLCIDAPVGHVWNDGCHSIVEAFDNVGGQSWKPEAYQMVADRMALGTSKCEDSDCDMCN